MKGRNATAAIIGAGDYIGASIAKKFAAAILRRSHPTA
jgi:NAD(P)-dependent dehydrogenase (short-subunit alcohol dehydrogenase family)